MADMMQFYLVSPEEKLISVEAQMVTVPGMNGDLTALPGHAPFLTTLRPGVVTVHTGGEVSEFFVTGGFVEISPTAISVLVEEAMEKSALTREFLDARLAEAEEAFAHAADDNKTAAAQLVNDYRGVEMTLGL